MTMSICRKSYCDVLTAHCLPALPLLVYEMPFRGRHVSCLEGREKMESSWIHPIILMRPWPSCRWSRAQYFGLICQTDVVASS